MHQRDMEIIAVKCVQELNRLGVHVGIEQDFQVVPSIMSEIGRPLGAANDPRKILMTKTNSLWVVGRQCNADGEMKPLIGCGIRVDDLGEECVDSFVSRSIEVLFGVKVSGVKLPTFTGQRWGRAAYIGGLTSAGSTGLGRSSKRIIQLLMAYSHYRAFTDLKSDTNYCFMRERDAPKGVLYGFLGADIFPWETSELIYEDGNPGWVMTTRRDQLPSLLVAALGVLA